MVLKLAVSETAALEHVKLVKKIKLIIKNGIKFVHAMFNDLEEIKRKSFIKNPIRSKKKIILLFNISNLGVLL